ncbi:hypothetical protein Dsin_026743 [Dipteronia sinensis]|uniref:Uncharacterized protein n=1 Tax=Dipteronia sinensis TaxID=43782 RepID=A0AAD9ZZS8_9ROSI|nr:hypothetical protein Dsin_026743 [Dipteronia sinensis]
MDMEVQIISKKLIKPSVPTPFHLHNMSISFMDQLLPPLYMPSIFYYLDHTVKSVKRQKQLEKSLSEILTLFYPLAGRYIKENLSVSCNDEGVEYIEALVNSQLSPILLGEFETKELNCFLPDELEESATSPLVAIQVNIFNCGGLAIGLRSSHRIIDGFTFSMFMNGWAKTCKVGNINDVTIPNFESGILFPPRDLSGFQFLHSPKIKSHELVTKVFSFDQETISKLKIEAGCKPSTTEVLTALIMRAKINAAAARARNRTCLLLVLMNLRGKTFRKIPENCCGNIYTRITARFEADESKILGFNDFVDQVRDAKRNTMMEYAKKECSDDEDGFFSKVVKPCIDIVEETSKGELDVHMFSSLISLPFHQADFGWGMPDWVSMGKMSSKSVFFIARSNGSGDKKGLIEAWVTMDKDDMAFFEKDPNIVMSTKPASTKIAIAIPP